VRALVKFAPGPGNVAVRDVPAPELTPGTILVDVHAVALCGTDRSAIAGGEGMRLPVILGHEVAGRIRAIAPDVTTHLAVGDRVTVETDAYRCGRCEYCRKEEYNRCPFRLGIGTTVDGGLADQLVMPADTVHRLPDGTSLVAGALTEPLAVAVHAVIERSPSLAGEVVVVIGPGAIGLLCAQVARAVGATVVLVGRSRHAARLALARELGVHHVIDSESADVEAFVKSLTDGYGAHSVFECSGAEGVVEGAAPLLRRGGRIVLVAFFTRPPAVDVDRLINHELELVGSRGKRASSFRTALRLMEAGQVDLERVVGARLPLDEWEAGIELVAGGMKVVVVVRPDEDWLPAEVPGARGAPAWSSRYSGRPW
jgi:2-desacetyl-2-hydroxyethyl bacteriochlorophyllide A dehydrogenase